MSDLPRFESLEGLRGTGKSTVAPLLAAARGAVLVPTVPLFYQPLRREIDERQNVEARMSFYLSALFMAAEEIERRLSAGTPVVVESYFARCLSSHQALGARLDVTLPADLAQPVTYQLVCTEDERRHRLALREKQTSRWDARSEDAAHRIADAYARFPMHQVDTTLLTPDQTVQAIIAIDTQGVRRAEPEPVATHPHVLPPVPRSGAGTRLP